jgi:hypothetical protein
MSSASACLPILKTALAKGGAIPGRLVGDMLVVEETHSSVREASTAHAGLSVAGTKGRVVALL